MAPGTLNIAIVGLGFGKEFIPIYQHHPNTRMYAICQRTREKLDAVGNEFGVTTRYQNFEDVIQDPKVDVVHINSPIHLHAPQAIAALRAGKHVASTVPAAQPHVGFLRRESNARGVQRRGAAQTIVGRHLRILPVHHDNSGSEPTQKEKTEEHAHPAMDEDECSLELCAAA